MKKISIYKIFTIASLLLVLANTSCKKDGKFFTKDINNDPTSTTTEQPNVLLAPAEVALAYAQHGDISRYAGIFTQYHYGWNRQFVPYTNYTFNNADFGNVWGTLYTTCMGNLSKIIKVSNEKKYPNYKGIAQVLMAYSMTLTSDMWNSIPYSTAFKGLDNLHPSYDSQSDIYKAAFKLCDSAIINLGVTGDAAGVLTPGKDDLIYGGDMDSWISFAHALKARMYLHLKDRDASAAANGLAEIALAFTSSTNNALVPFAAATYGDPWFQYSDQRGDIAFIGSNAYNMMITNGDARIDMLIDTTYDAIGPAIGGGGSSVPLITFAELKFIEAELSLPTDLVAAQAAYETGITESFKELSHGGEAAAYITAHPFPATDQLQRIIEEKYIAMFEHPETYTDWRRTGFPILSPNIGSAIPVRFLYPDSEVLYNQDKVPTGTNLYTKVWWDTH